MPMFYQELKRIPVKKAHIRTYTNFFFLLDEYATYIRLIDEMLEQRYNYVIQSRRTIETFPVGLVDIGFYKIYILFKIVCCC